MTNLPLRFWIVQVVGAAMSTGWFCVEDEQARRKFVCGLPLGGEKFQCVSAGIICDMALSTRLGRDGNIKRRRWGCWW